MHEEPEVVVVEMQPVERVERHGLGLSFHIPNGSDTLLRLNSCSY